MAYLASIAFIPFDRLWLRSRRNKMLGPARTPRDATELTETAAARLRTSRSGIPPFGLFPQCTCGALRASATARQLFVPVGCYFISNDVTRTLDTHFFALQANRPPISILRQGEGALSNKRLLALGRLY